MAIVLLGALVIVRDNSGPGSSSTVETFNPAPSSLVSTLASVPASVYDTVGVSSPAIPVTPPHAAGGTHAVWQATVNGGPPLPVVFFYGAEFAPYAAVRALAADPGAVALRDLQPARAHAVELDDGVRQPRDVHLLEVSYASRYVILESVERYSSLNPTGARYSGSENPDAARSPRRSPATGRAPPPSPCSTSPTATSSNGASFSPAVLAGVSPGPDRRRPDQPGLAADPGRRGGGERDHGGHLLGRREQARRGVREPGRAGGGPGAQGHAHALTRRRPMRYGRRWSGSGLRRPGQLARRSSISLRSTSFMPPQIPWGSRILMA